jgi:hypothetical protein
MEVSMLGGQLLGLAAQADGAGPRMAMTMAMGELRQHQPETTPWA